MIDFDKVLSRIGEFGPYQWVNVSILALLMLIMSPFPCYNYFFMLYVPPHACIEAGGANFTSNITKGLANQCLMPPNITGLPNPVKCKRWEYDTSEYVETAASKFDLVCDKAYLASLTQTISQISTAIGILPLSIIQDHYGRKFGLYLALAISGIAGVCLPFSPNIWVFILVRMVIASCVLCGWTFPYILAMEYVGPSKRTVVTMIMIVMYAGGAGVLGGVAWLCSHWQTLGWATAGCSLGFFVFYCTLDESPRWLLIRGKISSLKKLVYKIARRNRADITPHGIDMLIGNMESQLMSVLRLIQNPSATVAENSEEAPRVTILDLLKHRNLRYKLFLTTILYIVNLMVYLGIAFNSENIPGNRFLNFIMLMVMEVPSGLAIMLVVDRIGRIWPMTFFIILGGVSFLAASFTTQVPLIITLVAIAKFGVSASFGILCQVSGELFPTPVRGTCQGVVSLISNIFGAVMPLIIAASKDNKQLPMIIMGVMSVSAGSLGVFLPETMGTVLPESIEDAKKAPVGLAALRSNLACTAFRNARAEKKTALLAAGESSADHEMDVCDRHHKE